uniref:Cache sensor protein n=1 Tax=uncultured Thiotrichaceae bacterium TaxID=298394 RepID=A0A6S6UJ34_9GAMM|nr:MAG: Putative cache sensor protein [uncultured Thiotrichaceae bacterium]
MNKWTYLIGSGLVAFSLNTFAAEEAAMGTIEEAQAMSEKAAALVNEKGTDAFDVFADKEGGYQDKDLYVFCMDLEGKMLSHAVKPDLVEKNLIDYDKYGDTLFQDMIEVAKSDEGMGWVEYKWPYPETEELKPKKSYVIKNEKEFFCGVGAYAPAE